MNDNLLNVTEDTNWEVRESLDQDVFNLYKITVNAQTRILHETAVQDKLAIDMPVGFVFVSNLQFQPKIGGSKLDAIRKIVIIKSKDKFKEILEDNNIQDVRHKGSAKRDIKGARVDTHKYEGSVDMKDQSYSIESYCMIFHNEESYYIVGMAQPVEDIDDIFNNLGGVSFEPSEITRNIVLDRISRP